MEPSSHTLALSSNQNLRRGQKEVLAHFCANWNTVCQLPTGYGKTLTGAACYKAARDAGKANRLLWIVPRKAQADQAAESLPYDFETFFGVRDLARSADGKVKSWDFGPCQVQAINAHRLGQCEIFVVTVQSLMSPSTSAALRRMMSTGLWAVVIDEHHHYGDIEGSRWVQEVNALPFACRLAMSATPERSDRTSYFSEPHVRVRYKDAATEGAVKKLVLSVYDYTVDVIVDGEVVQYTCDELIGILEGKSEASGDIEAKMAERKMRWSPKYVSPLIEQPVARIVDRRLNGIRAQMLVQAMSCSHAKTLCEQIKAIVPDGMRVDWVGTGMNGRTPEENVQVLSDFCPPKDHEGKRNWSVDILVNVGIAGEGLDTVDVCEVVFCSRPSLTPSTLQTIGRAARTMKVRGEQPVAVINVDKVSPLREFRGSSIMGVFDLDREQAGEQEQEQPQRDPNEYEPMPDEPSVWVVNVEWTGVLEDPTFNEVFARSKKQIPSIAAQAEIDENGARIRVAKIMADIKNDQAEAFNGASQLAQIKDQVSLATTKLVNMAIRMAGGGLRHEKTLIGDIKKRINSRRKYDIGCGIAEASVEQARNHYAWCKRLEEVILENKRLPTWLA